VQSLTIHVEALGIGLAFLDYDSTGALCSHGSFEQSDEYYKASSRIAVFVSSSHVSWPFPIQLTCIWYRGHISTTYQRMTPTISQA